jgi:hypothetical protein
MSLERIGIVVDFEQPHPRRIVLFEHRVKPPASRFDSHRDLAVLFDRGFERLQLSRIDFELDDKDELSLDRIRRCTRAW